MAITFSSFSLPSLTHRNHNHASPQTFNIITRRFTPAATFNSFTPSLTCTTNYPKPTVIYSTGNGSGGGRGGGGGGGGGDGGGGGGGDESEDRDKNRREAVMALGEAGRSVESVDKDLAAAIQAGRVPGSIVKRYFELEKSAVFRWLLQFGGFKERLLADDLFLTKVGIECGVGIFTKVWFLLHTLTILWFLLHGVGDMVKSYLS
jgi:hypothetical protein